MNKKYGVVGSYFLSAILLGAGAHVLLGDYLLFHSDTLSLSIYLSALSLVVLPCLVVVSLPVLFVPREWRRRLRLYAALGLAVVVVIVFLMLAVSFVGAWSDVTFLKRAERYPLVLFAVCAIPALGLIVGRRNPTESADRAEQLGLALLAAAVLGLAATQVFRSESGTDRAAGPGKHLVLMVLDGMPSQNLHSYNLDAPIGPLDRLATEGLLFTDARSSAVWTYAYFGILNSGSLLVAGAPRDRRPTVESLFARLQRGGVSARWVVHHRNGMPEGSATHSDDYRGLRSYLLTENTAWIPRLLNLDYHLGIANPAIAQNLRAGFGAVAFDWINGARPKYRNVLIEQLLPLLREQRASADDSFMLFHVPWNGTGAAATQARAQLPPAQEIKGLSDIAKGSSEKIRADDYRYGPELEPLAEQSRRNAELSMVDAGVHLTDFFAALAADESVRDTVIVVTADHGSMYTKGRFWYGFHPSEEVVRVPLLAFNAGRTGRDNRPVNTLDINASVLGFFGLSRDGRAGQSIFGAYRDRGVTATLTLRSDRNKEWFLVLSEAGQKLQVNLHPGGLGETTTLRLNGYEELPIAESIGPPDGMAELIAKELSDFGIDPKDVHPAYRPLVKALPAR